MEVSDPADALLFHGGPHVFVKDLADPVLDDDDHHHLARALRLRDGDALTVGDGRGGWRSAGFGRTPTINGPIVQVPRNAPPICVGFALVKGSKPELVVQKLTELGVDRIVPFTAEHSVVRWDASKADRNVQRLRRVAREAAMQSHRGYLPAVEPLTSFDALATLSQVARADMDGRPAADLFVQDDPHGPVVLIGPEGGWSAAERAAVPDAFRFGQHVMRAETAAIAVASVLVASRSGLVGVPRTVVHGPLAAPDCETRTKS